MVSKIKLRRAISAGEKSLVPLGILGLPDDITFTFMIGCKDRNICAIEPKGLITHFYAKNSMLTFVDIIF